MVTMEMGEENIKPVPVNAQGVQLPLHCFPARCLPKTGIDQKAAVLPKDQVTVQGLQGTSCQGDWKSPEIICKQFHPLFPFPMDSQNCNIDSSKEQSDVFMFPFEKSVAEGSLWQFLQNQVDAVIPG